MSGNVGVASHLERSGRAVHAAPNNGAPAWRKAGVGLRGLRQPVGSRPAVRVICRHGRCAWWQTTCSKVRFASLHCVLTQVLPAQTTMVRRLHYIACDAVESIAAVYCPMRISRRIDRAVLHANGVGA
ncbi:hypothetical protein XavaCFBP5823_17525 [Xanthomonas axonopodis pv. vasculorum]|nr:hypothetical protein XavaCFBP5823_17525 [Xanthomonas axonopodis pv. vasculorum]